MALFANFKKYFEEDKTIPGLLDTADEGMQRDLELAEHIGRILVKLKEYFGRYGKEVEQIVKNWETAEQLEGLKEFLNFMKKEVRNLLTAIDPYKIYVGVNGKGSNSLKQIIEECGDNPKLQELKRLCNERLSYLNSVRGLIHPFVSSLEKLRDQLEKDENLVSLLKFGELSENLDSEKEAVKGLIEMEIQANKIAEIIQRYSQELGKFKALEETLELKKKLQLIDFTKLGETTIKILEIEDLKRNIKEEIEKFNSFFHFCEWLFDISKKFEEGQPVYNDIDSRDKMYDLFDQYKEIEKIQDLEGKIMRALLLKIAVDIESHKQTQLQSKAIEIIKRDKAIQDIEKNIATILENLNNLLKSLRLDFTEVLDNWTRKETLGNKLKDIVHKITRINEELENIQNELTKAIRLVKLRNYPYVEFRPIVRKAFRIASKRINVIILGEKILPTMPTIYSTRKIENVRDYFIELKEKYSFIPYVNDSPINKIIWDCQELLLDYLKSVLKDRPNYIDYNPLLIEVRFLAEKNAVFLDEASRIGYCCLAVGAIIVLAQLLHDMYSKNINLLRLLKKEEELGIKREPTEMGFIEMDLYWGLLHELTHYHSWASKEGKQIYGRVAFQINSTFYQNRCVESLKEEGLTRILDLRSERFIKYDYNEIIKLREKLLKLAEFQGTFYEIGFYMTYFIGVYLLKRKDRKKFESLRASYDPSLKSVDLFSVGFKKILAHEKIFFENLPLNFIDYIIDFIRKLDAKQFIKLYRRAARELGIPKECYIIDENHLKQMEREYEELLKKKAKKS